MIDHMTIVIMDQLNRPKAIFNGLLDLYLMGSSLVVSFWLVLADYGLTKFLMLTLVLFGNCYWIFRLESFRRIQELFLILNRPKPYVIPQRTYVSRIPQEGTWPSRASAFDVKRFESRLPRESFPAKSGIREFNNRERVGTRHSGLPITSIREIQNMGGNRDESMFDSKFKSRSSRKIMRGDMSQQLLDHQGLEQIKLQQKCQQTLQTHRIKKEVYWNGIQRTKSLLSFKMQSVVTKHWKNINELNQILIDNLDMPLIECNRDNFRQGRIYLDQLISTVKSQGALSNWRWMPHSSPSSRNNIVARLKTLVDQRLFIDKHLLINQSVDQNVRRQEAVKRLDRLSRDPSKTDHSFDSVAVFSQREDQLALFRLFEAYVNLSLPSECENLRVRSHYIHNYKQQDYKQIGFVMAELQNGLIHIDFVSGKTVFNCQPGNNNVYSAVYFYLRDLSVNHAKEMKLSNNLRGIVSEVIG